MLVQIFCSELSRVSAAQCFFFFCHDDKGLKSKLGDYCSLSEVWSVKKGWGILLLWQFSFLCSFHLSSHIYSSLPHTHTNTHTHSSQVIIFLTASTDMRKADFSTSRWERGGKAISTPEKDKSYVGGPGVLCKNPKVIWAWIHTSWHVDTEGQRDWKGDPFTRMTAPPSLSPGSISFQHLFFTLWGGMFVMFWVIPTIIIWKDEQHKDRRRRRVKRHLGQSAEPWSYQVAYWFYWSALQ